MALKDRQTFTIREFGVLLNAADFPAPVDRPEAKTIPEPAYQTVHQPLGQEHIYHSLDDNEGLPRNLNTCNTLGKLDVMLPNGQMVPATLVRNVSGRIVPLVEVDSKNINISPDPAVRTSRRSNNSNRHFL